MASAQATWGIDLGRCALKAVKLRAASDGKVDILDVEYIEHAKILSQPDANRAELISSALEKFLSRRDITKDRVVVNVPGQHTLSRFTKLPPVASKRIPDIVRYEADQQIPFDLDEVIWDYQTFQQEGLPDLEVGIFAMKRELIREHLLHFEQASIEPIAVQSAPLSVYNAANYDGMLASETTILLDIGAENTDLIIATPDTLWTRTVQIGGNSFTESLVKSFKLSFSKAEQLKRTAATSKYARQVFQAMRPVFADLVQELQRSIGFYSSTHRDAEIVKVVGMGNAFQLPGLQKYLQQNLGMDVDRPGQFNKANTDQLADKDLLREQFSSFASAYGLALQGLELTKVTSNLLPTEIAKQAVWRRKKPAFAAAAACLALAGGLIWFRQITDLSALAAGSDNPSEISSVDAASRIIDNGAPASLSTRARARSVIAAGDMLKKELNRLSGQGDTERADTEQFISLQENKTVMSGIIEIIHQSVPRLSTIAGVSDPDELRAKLPAAPARSKRKDVFIEGIDTHFEPDLNVFDFTGSFTIPPLNEYDEDSSSEMPGILVKIKCRSGNEGTIEFIAKEFMEPLRANGRRPERGYYFDQIALIKGEKYGAARRTGLRGRGGVQAGAGAAAIKAQDLDPVTFEPMTDDWRFEIWVTVILEDYPGGDEEEGDSGEEG